MEDTPSEFLRAVLPEIGPKYVSSVILSDGKVKQKAHDTIDQLQAHCDIVQSDQSDVYFALATYKQGWYKEKLEGRERWRLRTQENSSHLKSIWIDVDVGLGKEYLTREESVTAIKAFLEETGLPRPFIVDSGGGWHLFFCMDEALPIEEWQDLADRMHSATVKTKFFCDRTRTRDSAGMPRLPGTMNNKRMEPRPVVLRVAGEPIPATQMKAILGKWEPMPQERAKTYSVYSDEELAAVVANIPANLPDMFVPEIAPIIPARDVLLGCQQMWQQKGASEPVWRGMLATMRHTEEGAKVCHKLSAKDERYDYQTTQAKLDELEAGDISPYNCQTFIDLRPEICEKCPNFQKIRSPISAKPPSVLPTNKPEATPANSQSALQVAHEIQEGDGAGAPKIREYLTNSFRVNADGCHVKKMRSDNGQSYWHTMYEFPIFPIGKLIDRQPGSDTKVSYVIRHYRKGGFDDLQLDGQILMGNGFSGWMGNAGMLIQKQDREKMATLLIDSLKSADDELPEATLQHALGWDVKHKSFLLGEKIYFDTGDVISVIPKGKAAAFCELSKPVGELQPWIDAANTYNVPGMEWAQATVLAAFASPLMSMGSLEKAAIIYLTGEAGAGKSTALAVATGVYGDPRALTINKDDTMNARIEKLGMLNSISAMFDEMTDLSPKEASQLAYQITQGRGKDRLGEGGREMITNTTTWSTLPVMSANDSIINALSMHSSDASAQMSRVMELKAVNIDKIYSTEDRQRNDQLVREIPNNFGHAGDKYIRYITTHKVEILEMMRRVEAKFIERSGFTNSERFYTYMCTRLIVGGHIAKKLGLVSYDLKALFTYLVNQSLRMKVRVKRSIHQPETWLGDFLNEHMASRLDVISDSRPEGMKDNTDLGAVNDVNYVVKQPSGGRELAVRVVLDDNTVRISQKALKDWCQIARVSYDAFIEHMKETRRMLFDQRRVDLGKGTMYRATRVRVIELRLKDDDLTDDKTEPTHD